MEKETESLSEKRMGIFSRATGKTENPIQVYYPEQDVRKAVRRLKEVKKVFGGKHVRYSDLLNAIDEIFGEKLI